jgi:hypothetical protein
MKTMFFEFLGKLKDHATIPTPFELNYGCEHQQWSPAPCVLEEIDVLQDLDPIDTSQTSSGFESKDFRCKGKSVVGIFVVSKPLNLEVA